MVIPKKKEKGLKNNTQLNTALLKILIKLKAVCMGLSEDL